MRQSSRQKLVRAVGAVLMVAALWFLYQATYRHWTSLGNWRPTSEIWLGLAVLALLYGASQYLLAESWHRVAALYGTEPRRRTYPSLTSMQFARYLPGNVAHLLGRAAWLHGGSLSNVALMRATFIEICVTPTGALLALLLLLPVLVVSAPANIAYTSIVAPLVIGAICLTIELLKPEGVGCISWVGRLKFSLILSTLFMLIFGSIFAIIGQMLGLAGIEQLVAVAVMGWIVGYLVPGAPGGIGVREAVMVALLSGSEAADTVLLASALLRLVTMLGEAACFVSGFVFVRLMGSIQVRGR